MLTFQEHRLLGREAVRKSLVLLKNGKDQKEHMLTILDINVVGGR